jgi:membrane dipeptidase
MRRRAFLRKCVLSTGSVLAAPMLNIGRCRLYAGTGREYSVRTINLVGRSLVIDMLGLITLDWPRLRNWHSDPDAFQEKDFESLQESGITVFHPAVDLNKADAHAETRQWLTSWNRFIAAKPDKFAEVRQCSDLTEAKQNGRIGILLGMQNSDHFRSAADVADFYALGQRVSQLTYNGPNRIGDGCINRYDSGLTPFGDTIVRAMNESGMVIDVSHAGERTTLDTFEASSKPVLITHSNCKALTPHPRCKSDAVIRAMAQQGGVMGITSIRAFVRRRGQATLSEALDHFDHVARLVGVEHVGIGSDTDLASHPRGLDAAGLNTPRRIFDITEGLLRRGYKEADVELILGGNFRRVLGNILC